jgi:hypothetical protein
VDLLLLWVVRMYFENSTQGTIKRRSIQRQREADGGAMNNQERTKENNRHIFATILFAHLFALFYSKIQDIRYIRGTDRRIPAYHVTKKRERTEGRESKSTAMQHRLWSRIQETGKLLRLFIVLDQVNTMTAATPVSWMRIVVRFWISQ